MANQQIAEQPTCALESAICHLQFAEQGGNHGEEHLRQRPEGWCSYDYHASIVDDGVNVFVLAVWAKAGGVNDSGYVWTNHRRWSADVPENPVSILPLIFYQRWAGADPVDLRGAEVSVYLRGDGLQLHGASCYFWVIADGTRWHLTSHPLAISEGRLGSRAQPLHPAQRRGAVASQLGRQPAEARAARPGLEPCGELRLLLHRLLPGGERTAVDGRVRDQVTEQTCDSRRCRWTPQTSGIDASSGSTGSLGGEQPVSAHPAEPAGQAPGQPGRDGRSAVGRHLHPALDGGGPRPRFRPVADVVRGPPQGRGDVHRPFRRRHPLAQARPEPGGIRRLGAQQHLSWIPAIATRTRRQWSRRQRAAIRRSATSCTTGWRRNGTGWASAREHIDPRLRPYRVNGHYLAVLGGRPALDAADRSTRPRRPAGQNAAWGDRSPANGDRTPANESDLWMTIGDTNAVFYRRADRQIPARTTSSTR